MEVQTALNKALEQQGFSYENAKATPQIKWQNRENDYLTKLCEDSGLTVDHPKNGKKHLNTDIYKLTKQKEEAEEIIKTLTSNVKKLQSELNDKKQEIESILTFLNIPQPPKLTFKNKPQLISKDDYVEKNKPKDFDKSSFIKKRSIVKNLEKKYAEKEVPKYEANLRLYEEEQVEYDEYINKYSQIANLQEREQHFSEEVRKQAEELAKVLYSKEISEERTKRNEAQSRLKAVKKESENEKKKLKADYERDIRLLNEQLETERELINQFTEYIADMESISCDDENERINKVIDFIEEQKQIIEELENEEPPEYIYDF